MNKLLSKLGKIAYYSAFSLIILLLSYLTYSSFTQTAMMDYNMSEYTYFVQDNIFINIIFTFIFSLILYLIAKVLSHFKLRYIYFSFMLIITIYMTYLISNINLHPSWDALFVNNAACDLQNGIYDAFLPGNYLATYPFLIPTVLYYYLLNLIFGTNYIAFQLCNLLLLLVMYSYLVKTSLLLKNKTTAIIGLLLIVCFIPLQMYVIFLYSNIPSACFMAISVYYLTKYLLYKTHSYLIWGFIALTMAILFKGTSYVILIAFVICFLLSQIYAFKLKSIIISSLCILILLATPSMVNYSIESMHKEIDLSNKLYAKIALVMGSSWGGRCAGWYTGYGQVLQDKYGNDLAAKKLEANRQLAENYYNLWSSHEFWTFYDIKSRSMWTNPEFQGFWTITANKEQNRGQGEKDKQSFLFIHYERENDWYSKITQSFFYGFIHDFLAFMLNILQNIIYLFTLLYMIYHYKRPNYATLFISLILLGGFLFLALWEGKAQYAILYYIQIFPLAAVGIYNTFDYFEKRFLAKNQKEA
ncbi:MAG: hypothetical protein SPH32_06775 [Erysipelotrichaceae bacterium]|nr:hypothetical protein [Erysipelotrichaceae bacterium]